MDEDPAAEIASIARKNIEANSLAVDALEQLALSEDPEVALIAARALWAIKAVIAPEVVL